MTNITLFAILGLMSNIEDIVVQKNKQTIFEGISVEAEHLPEDVLNAKVTELFTDYTDRAIKKDLDEVAIFINIE